MSRVCKCWEEDFKPCCADYEVAMLNEALDKACKELMLHPRNCNIKYKYPEEFRARLLQYAENKVDNNEEYDEDIWRKS